MLRAALLCAVLAFLAAMPGAWADTVLMRNGDRLSGRVVGLNASSLELRTEYAGDISLALDRIERLDTDAPITVVLKDDTRLPGLLEVRDGRVSIAAAAGAAAVALVPARVSSVEQGVVPAAAWVYNGRVTLGASSTSGNSDVSRANADAELVARRGRTRVTAGLRGAYARDSDEDTEGNAAANAKLDRFVTEKWYAYANSSLEYDPFRDLRLRATAGAGSGYQVLDSARTALSLEGGLEYVSTQYYDQPDEDFPAGRAAVRLDHWLWQDVMQLFLRAEGYANLEAIERSFVRTQTGLRFPLRDKFLAQAQVNVDWQGDPPPGTTSTDRTLIFSLGYQW